MTSIPPNSMERSSEKHEFIRPRPADSRSPCPALNVLANHGYIPRDGLRISFLALIQAIAHVYNTSILLAFLLAGVGFITCGRIICRPSEDNNASRPTDLSSKEITHSSRLKRLKRYLTHPLHIQWIIDLEALSQRGSCKIAHDASLVHPTGFPSTAPQPLLVHQLLQYAVYHPHCNEREPCEGIKAGLSLTDIARIHAAHEMALEQPLSNFHEQVALGECSLAWCILRSHSWAKGQTSEEEDVIPLCRLEQWFGEERLPDDWWNSARPFYPVGLFEARRRAKAVEKVERMMKIGA